ncbi:L-fuconate dehydratase [Lachnospiraceae bacterium KM106-2]|nr:L-fuconate dehydratase [Lachnospiraceae bacterium KM106-2]
MKKWLHKKLVPVFLSMSMIVTMIPVSALASSTGSINSGDITIDQVKYYAVESENIDHTDLFIKDMLLAQNKAMDNYSPAAFWNRMAYFFEAQVGEHSSKNEEYGIETRRGMNIAANHTDLSKEYRQDSLNIGYRDDDKYNIVSTGLRNADSMKAAGAAIEKRIYEEYKRADGDRNEQSKAVATNTMLSGNTDKNTVFYNLMTEHKTSGKNRKGHYEATAILFSDFKATPVIPDDVENCKVDAAEPVNSSEIKASLVKNDTNGEAQASQELSKTVSQSFTSEVNGSKNYQFGECITTSQNWGFKVFSIGVSEAFSANQSIENGWSESKSSGTSETTTYNIGVTLPPYTQVMLKQDSSLLKKTLNYKCPIGLTCKVTVIEYFLEPDDSDAQPVTKNIATFNNARKDLVERAITNKSLDDPDGINWITLDSYIAEAGQVVIEKKPVPSGMIPYLAYSVPMSRTGAKMVYEYKSIVSSVLDKVPLYSLKTIQPSKSEINLQPGNSINLDEIKLQGLNGKNGTYYGFDVKKGKWTLTDAQGNPVAADVAELILDSHGRPYKLDAKKDATVNLKYVINEDAYNSQENKEYTKNTDINTAMVKVVIKTPVTPVTPAPSQKKAPTVAPVKGKTYTVSGLKYVVTKAKTNGTGTVSIKGTTKKTSNKKFTSLTIGKTVKIKGFNYKITAISDKAYKNYKYLKKVTVGANVTKIGKDAFYNCKVLKSITIKSSKLTSVGKNAIKKINKKAIIKVPSKKLSKYKKLFKSSTGFKKTMKIKK